MVIEVKKGYTELKFTQNENFNGEEQLAKFQCRFDKGKKMAAGNRKR